MSVENQNTLPSIENIKHNWLFYFLPYLALVLLHVALTLKMQYPNIWDEFGYLGRARYMSGIADIPKGIGRYHFGYSLFLLPSFWLFSDPYYVYKSVLITNSFLISSLYFPLFYTLHTLLNTEKRLSVAISVVCCLYPAFMLQSNLAWSESAFIPIYASFIATFGAFIKHKTYLSLFLFSFLTGFLYTVHPRALLILPFVICYMFLLMWLGYVTKRQLFLSVLLVICIYFITNSINDHFLSLGSGETSKEIITQKVLRLFIPASLILLFLKSSGQLLYLLLATYGVFLLGLWCMFTIFFFEWKQARLAAFSHTEFNTISLLALSSLAIFIASSLQMLIGERADHLCYGRYNEGFLSLYLMLGLLGLHRNQLSHIKPVMNACLTSFLVFVLLVVVLNGYGRETLSKMSHVTNVNVINVLGIYPFIGVFRKLNITAISLISIPLIMLLGYIFRYRFRLGLILLALYFCIVSMSGYTVFYVRASYIQQITVIASHIRSLGDVEVVSYDKAFRNGDTWRVYQYLLPEVEFKSFDSASNELPVAQIVISGKTWKDKKRLGAKLIARENSVAKVPLFIRRIIGVFFDKPLAPERRIDQSLWILPEKAGFPLSAPVE